MAQQHVLVRKIPPVLGLDWRMYARNLSTGDVKMIPEPDCPDPYLAVIGELMPGVWIDPKWAWDRDNMRRYTVAV